MNGQAEEPSGDEPIIICRDVHKWYGHFHALKGVSMEVQKGEVIVIFGPSGSGKSTFIRTINRLEEHQDGQIIVDGTELTKDVHNIERVRMETGMVFQQFNLFPHLTVLQNVSLAPIHVRKWPKAKAEEIALATSRTGWVSRSNPTNSPGISPVGSNSASPSPAPWQCSPRSCSSTSQPQPSTPK